MTIFSSVCYYFYLPIKFDYETLIYDVYVLGFLDHSK